jgi:hypothetical protein
VVASYLKCQYGHLSNNFRDSMGNEVGVLHFNNVREGASLCFYWHYGGTKVKASRLDKAGERYPLRLEREGVESYVGAGVYLHAGDTLRGYVGGVALSKTTFSKKNPLSCSNQLSSI